MRIRSSNVFLSACFAALLVSLGGCAGSPTVGKDMHGEIVEQGSVYDNPTLQAYVNRVGQRLVANSDDAGSPFTFTVVDSPDINAFALPGGYIYITRGLLAYLESKDVERLLAQPPVAQKLAALKIEYLIWLDGSTVRKGGSGSMACSLGGCFGFGTWTHDADYEAVIWDFTDKAEVGHVATTATGQSYMPAVIVPIPIIAPVQGTACDAIGVQLLEFLSSKH